MRGGWTQGFFLEKVEFFSFFSIFRKITINKWRGGRRVDRVESCFFRGMVLGDGINLVVLLEFVLFVKRLVGLDRLVKGNGRRGNSNKKLSLLEFENIRKPRHAQIHLVVFNLCHVELFGCRVEESDPDVSGCF